ncbi:MAG TPA: helix-turn-helix transcriptional regulator [Trebonia sp.]|nr:helix-turn-helix transcriptional regulator [Trebonia sp.]
MGYQPPGERVAAVLPALYAICSAEAFPARAVSVATGLIGGDKGEFTQVDLDSGDVRVYVDPEPSVLQGLAPARASFMHQHPVLNYFFSHQTAQGTRLISDFLSQAEFHRLGIYGEFFSHLDVEDQMSVMASAPGSRSPAGVSVDRGRPGFWDDDRVLLDLLQPHLIAAQSNAILFSQALSGGSGPAALSGPDSLDRLSDRQRNVLALIALGLTNAEIAKELWLSEGTVRKHAENIRLTLGVRTRTAAAARYLRSQRAPGGANWTAFVAGMLTPCNAVSSGGRPEPARAHGA